MNVFELLRNAGLISASDEEIQDEICEQLSQTRDPGKPMCIAGRYDYCPCDPIWRCLYGVTCCGA